MMGAQVLAPQAARSAEAPKVDLAKGQAIASGACAACHGADGNSPTPANPRLAGQIPEYLHKQLLNFKPGGTGKAERANPVMAGFAAMLSADDARNVSAYYATQKPAPGAARNKDTLLLGQRLYRGGDPAKGLAACAGCHGATGSGVPVQYPRLAGQYAEYTESQLKAFRAKERGNDAAGMMRSIAAKMSDAEIRAVADYIAGLR
ncbi:MAG: cytochrome c4 [Betaproteobacteria bacterium]|nr:cytochrome c4 [Betaproteobacteria bacterium]